MSWERLHELLGEACRIIFGNSKRHNLDFKDKLELAAFYVDFMRDDERRQAEKQMKLQKKIDAALAKLSYDDKKILGLIK